MNMTNNTNNNSNTNDGSNSEAALQKKLDAIKGKSKMDAKNMATKLKAQRNKMK